MSLYDVGSFAGYTISYNETWDILVCSCEASKTAQATYGPNFPRVGIPTCKHVRGYINLALDSHPKLPDLRADYTFNYSYPTGLGNERKVIAETVWFLAVSAPLTDTMREWRPHARRTASAGGHGGRLPVSYPSNVLGWEIITPRDRPYRRSLMYQFMEQVYNYMTYRRSTAWAMSWCKNKKHHSYELEHAHEDARTTVLAMDMLREARGVQCLACEIASTKDDFSSLVPNV